MEKKNNYEKLFMKETSTQELFVKVTGVLCVFLGGKISLVSRDSGKKNVLEKTVCFFFQLH